MKACTILPTILLLTKDSTCSTKPATQTRKFYFPKITQEDPAYNSPFLSKDSKLDAQSLKTGNKSLYTSDSYLADHRSFVPPKENMMSHISTGKVSEELNLINF